MQSPDYGDTFQMMNKPVCCVFTVFTEVAVGRRISATIPRGGVGLSISCVLLFVDDDRNIWSKLTLRFRRLLQRHCLSESEHHIPRPITICYCFDNYRQLNARNCSNVVTKLRWHFSNDEQTLRVCCVFTVSTKVAVGRWISANTIQILPEATMTRNYKQVLFERVANHSI